jgi:hypothetical protein
MKNFEVHELVNGWTGQVASLEEALALRDEFLRDSRAYEVKITAEVDESDL